MRATRSSGCRQCCFCETPRSKIWLADDKEDGLKQAVEGDDRFFVPQLIGVAPVCCTAARHHAGATPPLATSPVPPSSDIASPALPSVASLGRQPASLKRGPARCESPHRCSTSTAACRSAWPCTAPPELHRGREERERERERKEEKKEATRREKEGRGEKRKKKRKGKKKKINYLFVENMISKLYCLLLFGKENKM
jgi:hypothetical protein